MCRPHHIVHGRHHLLHLHLHLLNLHCISLRVGVVHSHILHLHLHLLHLCHLLLLRSQLHCWNRLSHRHLVVLHLLGLRLVVSSHDISKGVPSLRLLLLRLGSWLLSREAHRFESIIRLLLGWLIETHV